MAFFGVIHDTNDSPATTILFRSLVSSLCPRVPPRPAAIAPVSLFFSFELFSDIQQRVLVLDGTLAGGKERRAFVNPVIVERTEKLITTEEGCLSFPNLFLSIARPTRIKVQYQDVSKKLNTIELTDYYARGFLHELDHLNGIVFTSHAGKLALKMARKKLYKKMKKYKQS